MTSLELVDFINQQRKEGEPELLHKNFLAKVPDVLGGTSADFSADLPDAYGRPRRGYRFPKREACLMAMSYSYDMHAKVFDRMAGLAAKQTEFLLTRKIGSVISSGYGLTMSSREIAELTGKDHGNVMRDIRALVQELQASNLNPVCKTSTYTGNNGQEYPHYELDKDTTFAACLRS